MNELKNVIDESGKTYDLSKENIVLFCYPKDNTPGCTIEAKEFSSLKDSFKEKGFSVFGLSKGDSKSHSSFVKKCDLTVPLLVDENGLLLEKLGVVKQKSLFGKPYKSVSRSTFIIENGKVSKTYENVNPLGHAKKVFSEL